MRGRWGIGMLAAAALAALPAAPASAQHSIVGGSATDVQEVPWQVLFLWEDAGGLLYQCGGSILDATHVATAAHCSAEAVASRSRVYAGISRSDPQSRSAGQVREIAAIAVHPSWDPGSNAFDAAVLTLSQPLDLSGPRAKAIELVTATESARFTSATNFTVSGWGTTQAYMYPAPNSGSSSTELRKVEVPFVSDTDCDAAYESSFYADGIHEPSMLCAGATNRDSCQGDSGGPLAWRTPAGTWRLAGIVSWGEGCATSSYPGVYSEVPNASIRAFLAAGLTSAESGTGTTTPGSSGSTTPGSSSGGSTTPGTGSGTSTPGGSTTGTTTTGGSNGTNGADGANGTASNTATTTQSESQEQAVTTGGQASAPEEAFAPEPLAAPLATLLNATCGATRCVLLYDLTGGATTLEASVSSSYRSWCRKGRRRTRCTKTRTRRLTAQALTPTLHMVVARNLPRGLHTITAIAADTAGNRQSEPTRFTGRTPRARR